MNRRLLTLAAGLALTASAHVAGAQSRDRGKDDVPRDRRPPPGLCRIWLDNVPASQQPAPTDCATAVRNRPEGAKVIFPDDRATPSKARLPMKSLKDSGDPVRSLLPSRDAKPPKKPKKKPD